MQVKDLMTAEVFTLKESDSLKAARSLMSLARIRHIPIVDERHAFLGLVTHRDILEATISKFADVDHETQDAIDAGIPIRQIMRSDATCVQPDAAVRDAAQILLDHKYGCLPVVEDGILCGIITEADFLRLAITLMEALES
ncbi:MAG: CBS domain-containing protein [Desulfovibrionaceae bacterium]